MDFMLSRATRVTAQWASAPVQHAVARFWRDMEMTLSTTGFVPDNRLMISRNRRYVHRARHP